MKVNLTLQEKLRDLRDERKLKLHDVADATSIPLYAWAYREQRR
jgi:cytoskeletal protein RodZ